VDYSRVVTKINVHDAKTNLSKYLDRVEAGETLIVCRNNRPVAELRPLPSEGKRKPRIPGFFKDKFVIPPTFFDPLPEDELRIWNGEEG
jgi:prevent-host-death family protein